ncbi:MAG: isochorismatase family protein [Alphaproteobacteria bacterium]|nr:isochorismatase family protein [Alphaproteobacteria bacterium]
MTIAFYENHARHPLGAATLVLVDLCYSNLTENTDLSAPATAGILERCQTALQTARRFGVPVVFVHDHRSGDVSRLTGRSRWFTGFEPRRYESVVASSGPSCYASPYFSEILDGSGRTLLVAGLLGLSAARATAEDAARHGHRLVVLSDAVAFDSCDLVPETQDNGGQSRPGAHAVSTGDWITEISPAPPPRSASWHQGSQLRRSS